MLFRSKIKWAALGGLILSLVSIVVHLVLAKYSTADLVQYHAFTTFNDDISLSIGGSQVIVNKRLWGKVKSLRYMQPYSNARTVYPEPSDQGNGFIYANVFW